MAGLHHGLVSHGRTVSTLAPVRQRHIFHRAVLPLIFLRNLTLCAGVIDGDYRGNVGVILFNHSDAEFKSTCLALRRYVGPRSYTRFERFATVAKGDRIAQLVLEKISTPAVQEVASLSDT